MQGARLPRQAQARAGRAGLKVVAKDFPYPDKVKDTDNFRNAAELSRKFKADKTNASIPKKKVAVIGGGLR